MKAIGLDIGTTTICAIVIDTEEGKVLHAASVANDAVINSEKPYERIQSPNKILEKCMSIVENLVDRFAPISCIGITGQMHGLLYIDKDGDAVSPLYYWQDESGNQKYKDPESFAQYLSRITGYNMATGFGATTYFCHNENLIVPENAKSFCTIHDYVAMKLCENKMPIMHTSNAASYGLFDLNSLAFDREAIEKSGLDYNMFPIVTSETKCLGFYEESIPVSVAIGDNQASFLGSVNDVDSCILVNVGTGSQVSFSTELIQPHEGTELRPLIDDSYICVGSSLCGGRAFAMLEKFLRETANLVAHDNIKSAYPAIDKYLENSEMPEPPLDVSTRFSGSREQPEERGSIKNIGTNNFNPQALIWGILNGMVQELKSMYPFYGNTPHSVLIGSGNGLRKNKTLQNLFSKSFGMELKIPVHCEEAAFGAALFGMTASGIFESMKKAQSLIKYE
ncbi:MAG TPA: FGGY family carbohydrate kinase [Clostridia bacterium]|nr:FGGY family carbohydrate kinase [Clostridia bacterium]